MRQDVNACSQLLYQVQTVFPSPEISENSSNSQYTLLAGQYVYPFKFRFPFNNNCSKNTSLLKDLKVGQLNVQFAPDTNQHVKKALPPTLSGFAGEAEIKYYVKATVVRPKFYQENLRSVRILALRRNTGLIGRSKSTSNSYLSSHLDQSIDMKKPSRDGNNSFRNILLAPW